VAPLLDEKPTPRLKINDFGNMADPLPTLFSESMPALQIRLKIPPQILGGKQGKKSSSYKLFHNKANAIVYYISKVFSDLQNMIFKKDGRECQARLLLFETREQNIVMLRNMEYPLGIL